MTWPLLRRLQSSWRGETRAVQRTYQEQPLRNLFLAMLAICAVFAIVSTAAQPPMDTLQLEFALNWTQRAFGGLIAVAAGFMLLARAARNETLEQLLPPTLAALVGVLIAAANWGVAVAVGALTVAVIVRGSLRRD